MCNLNSSVHRIERLSDLFYAATNMWGTSLFSLSSGSVVPIISGHMLLKPALNVSLLSIFNFKHAFPSFACESCRGQKVMRTRGIGTFLLTHTAMEQCFFSRVK